MRLIPTTDAVRQLAYTRDGERVVACLGKPHGIDLLERWDLHTGEMLGSIGIPGWPASVAITFERSPTVYAFPDGDSICYFSDNDARTRDFPIDPRSPTPDGDVWTVSAVGLRPDASYIAYCSFPPLSHHRSTIFVAEFERPENVTKLRTGIRVRTLLFSPSGQYLISIGAGQYTVWDLHLRESRTAGTLTELRPITYSPDGKLLAVVGKAGATLFDASGSQTIRFLNCASNLQIKAIAFSPDNRSLALAAGPAIHFFDVESGIVRNSYDWNIGPIYSLAFAPDGLTAAAGADRHIVVWDLDD